MISILIATKNRPREIIACVRSILKNSNQQFEIIVIDQSTNQNTQDMLRSLRDVRLISLRDRSGGKSVALNKGIPQARGDILAFTDDDCIVSKQWVQSIADSLREHPSVSAVFGQTKPYRADNVRGMTCPALFSPSRAHSINRPCYHATHIGFGNNMAIRKSVFDELGGFRSWLGPGSIGLNTEDAEMALRLLSSGCSVYANPRMLVFHNKWMRPSQARKQELVYACGEMACYGYYYFQGYSFALPILKKAYKKDLVRFFKSLLSFFARPWKRATGGALFWSVRVLMYRLWGTSLGWYFSNVQPLRSVPLTKHS